MTHASFLIFFTMFAVDVRSERGTQPAQNKRKEEKENLLFSFSFPCADGGRLHVLSVLMA